MANLAGVAVALVLVSGPGPQQAQPRDARPPAHADAPTLTPEAALQKQLATSPSAQGFLVLGRMQEARGALDEAEASMLRARELGPQRKDILTALGSLYNRRGQFEKAIEVVSAAAKLDPANPQGYQLVATYYWEKAQKDKALSPVEKWTYIAEGLAATDQALAINPDYVESLTYKNILLRMRGQLETDPAQQAQTFAEADALRTRAIALNKSRTLIGPAGGTTVVSTSMPPPPPPPGMAERVPTGTAPIRVGGAIRAPVKIRNAAPVYPAELLHAGIGGIVILELTIGVDGAVSDAKVLKSIPPLDQAALDAVRQWAFEPTLLNGQPVPVIMTATVNFTAQQN